MGHPDFARAYPFLPELIIFLRTLFVPIRTVIGQAPRRLEERYSRNDGWGAPALSVKLRHNFSKMTIGDSPLACNHRDAHRV